MYIYVLYVMKGLVECDTSLHGNLADTLILILPREKRRVRGGREGGREGGRKRKERKGGREEGRKGGRERRGREGSFNIIILPCVT